MIFAVSMTFIDQTIVAIAAPELQKDLAAMAVAFLVALVTMPGGKVEVAED